MRILWTNQSFFISAYHCYTTLKFVLDVGPVSNLTIISSKMFYNTGPIDQFQCFKNLPMEKIGTRERHQIKLPKRFYHCHYETQKDVQYTSLIRQKRAVLVFDREPIGNERQTALCGQKYIFSILVLSNLLVSSVYCNGQLQPMKLIDTKL